MIACIIPVSVVVVLGIIPVLALTVVAVALLIGFIVSLLAFQRNHPSVIGLADEKIVLKYARKRIREMPWREVSRCVMFQDKDETRVIVSNKGEFIPLPVSDEIAERIVFYWKKKT
jgi:hypothetical protein